MTPEQFMQLASQYDPAPILFDLSKGMGGATDQQAPYSQMVNGAQPTAPGAAPLDMKSMMGLNSLMPKPSDPRFVGGAAPQKGPNLNLSVADLVNLVKIQQGSAGQTPAPAPTLSSLIGGR